MFANLQFANAINAFFVVSLSGFGIRVMVAPLNEFGSVSTSAIFWKSLIRIS